MFQSGIFNGRTENCETPGVDVCMTHAAKAAQRRYEVGEIESYMWSDAPSLLTAARPTHTHTHIHSLTQSTGDEWICARV